MRHETVDSGRWTGLRVVADLFTYPRADYLALVETSRAALQDTGVEASFREFADAIRPLSKETLEELYTQTFDLNPVCCLDLGWHLFGENYERGEFLVRMRNDLRRHGVEETGELPDHLSHVLKLLAAMPETEAASLAASHVQPGLEKMRAGFEGGNSPFANLILTAIGLVQPIAGGAGGRS